MSQTFDRVQGLIAAGDVKVSEHGYDQLAADGISGAEVLAGAAMGRVIEDYPGYTKGACVLVLQTDRDGNGIHVLWGIPKGQPGPAVLITAYRPDPGKWADGFLRRRA